MVFAEILLQSIDVKIKKRLKNLTPSIVESSDYVIKRYVDDYFLFYNDEGVRRVIYDTVIDELAEYKLFCNESKNKKS